MILMFGLLDRFLDLIGIISIIYWTIRVVSWWWRRKHPAQAAAND